MSGKGDSPRPLSVSEEEFGKRFDAIDWSVTRSNEDYVVLKSEGEMGFVGKPSNFRIYSSTPGERPVIAVDCDD